MRNDVPASFIVREIIMVYLIESIQQAKVKSEMANDGVDGEIYCEVHAEAVVVQ